jgi:hypothetical protein
MGNYHQLKNKNKKYFYINKLPNRGKLVRLGDVPVGTRIYETPKCLFEEIVVEQLYNKTKVQHFISWDLGWSEYKYIFRDNNEMVYIEVEE